MRVDKALEQISEIHEHLAKSQMYRGYRGVPTAISGVLALFAALMQPLVSVRGGSASFYDFIYYWIAIAVIAFCISVAGVIARFLREEDEHNRQRTVAVVGQLAPSLAAGVVVTVAFIFAGQVGLLMFLPGIWSLLFSLGLFSSKPFLPRRIGWVAVFYFLCGCVLLQQAAILNPRVVSPWSVGVPFGVGQIASGLILYWNLERKSCDVC